MVSENSTKREKELLRFTSVTSRGQWQCWGQYSVCHGGLSQKKKSCGLQLFLESYSYSWPCELGNKICFTVFASISPCYQVLIFPMRTRVTENTGLGRGAKYDPFPHLSRQSLK